MTTYTTLRQDSAAIIDDAGASRFRVVSSIAYVKPGDLPWTPISEVFVHEILEVADPKQDKFLRVANIHDLTTLARGRVAALNALQTTYLSAMFTVEFADVTTAAAAKAVVQTRVDALIADWIKYSTEFLVPIEFTMPAPEATLVKAAKAAFKTAKNARIEKEAALVTANAASAEAVAAAERASATYAAALTRTNNCSEQSTRATSAKSAVDAFRAAMAGTFKAAADLYKADTVAAQTTFIAQANATTPDVTFQGHIDAFVGTTNTLNNTFQGVLNTALGAATTELQNGKPLLDDLVDAIAAACAADTFAVTTAATAKTTADGTVATTQTAQAQAQAAATAAAAAETAALAAVLAVCSDFDPNA